MSSLTFECVWITVQTQNWTLLMIAFLKCQIFLWRDDLFYIFLKEKWPQIVYFDFGLKVFCLFDFPLNMLFKCKGTTESASRVAAALAAFASGVFKLCSVLLAVLPSWSVQGNSLLPAWVAAKVLFTLFSSCLESSLHRTANASSPVWWVICGLIASGKDLLFVKPPFYSISAVKATPTWVPSILSEKL